MEDNVSYQDGKLLFLAKVIEIFNRKNTYNYIALANFNRDSPKINFKMVFRRWGTQGQLSLRDMSLSDDEILERGTRGQLSLRDMSLSDDEIL